jgi:hypothetical protein
MVLTILRTTSVELELELIQTKIAQKPILRAEVYARALRASQRRLVLRHQSRKIKLSEFAGSTTNIR